MKIEETNILAIKDPKSPKNIVDFIFFYHFHQQSTKNDLPSS